MTNATIRCDLFQALDIQHDVAAKITLYAVIFFNDIANLVYLIRRQIFCARIGTHLGGLQNILGKRRAYAKHVGECHLYPLIIGNVCSYDAHCLIKKYEPYVPNISAPPHILHSSFIILHYLSLALFMPWVFTDDKNPPLTAYNLTVIADLFYRRLYLHANVVKCAISNASKFTTPLSAQP